MTENQLSALPDCEPDGRVSRLIRNGIVRPARAEAHRALLTDQPPRPNAGASAVEALLEELRKGRRILEQISAGLAWCHCEERSRDEPIPIPGALSGPRLLHFVRNDNPTVAFRFDRNLRRQAW